ncbi:hypothetical protein [Hyphomicrobium sulfonivorans]|uniref:hypothetical protein n=1 Tax=Hyphomicrobium sulfonivorans TaxID=121290 RepID=UPI00156E589F|nr:hypothetical protein [Hyphomicrobium sulfonivorans]MBI1651385.1 hypothetical protein [Hyphomicrobium sulfonivorans]
MAIRIERGLGEIDFLALYSVAAMIPKSSSRQNANSVSQVLMPDTEGNRLS